MTGPQVIWWLRIAWSVWWGIVCVLLAVLWVRSYWYWDQLYNPITNKHLIIVESASSRVILVLTSTVPGSTWIWHISQELNGEYWVGPLGDQQASIRDLGFLGFAYFATAWNTTYRAPYWFLILLIGIVATLPWLGTRRFSLRTLLIATTLIAVVLATAAALRLW